MLGSHVIPVIEPLKITSTFSSAVKVFIGKNQTIAVILNPSVGDLSGSAAIGVVLPSISGSAIPAIIIGKDTIEAMSALATKGIPASGVLTFITNRD